MSNILEKKKLEEAEEHVRLESFISYYFLIVNNYFLIVDNYFLIVNNYFLIVNNYFLKLKNRKLIFKKFDV